jgi:Fe-S-cluster-containing dehydrogenase component
VFGDLDDPNSRVNRLLAQAREEGRVYRLLEDLGTEPVVYYLKKVDPEAPKDKAGH